MSLHHDLRIGFARRVPLILQTEAAECGLACLAMVASYHGMRSDLPTLRQRHQISMKGVNLHTLIKVAAKLDLSARPVRLELTELRQLQLPCVLHWDLNHFVVLTAVRGAGVTIHDPGLGERKLSLAEVSKHFTGIALELQPTTEFVPKTEVQHISIRAMMGRVTGLKRTLGQVFLLALALEAFTLAGPFFMQWVTDSVLPSSDRDLLFLLVLGFALLQLVQQTTSAMRSWVLMHLSVTLNIQWTANIFRHLLRLPVSYFEKRHVGDVVSRFGAVSNIQRTLTGSFLEGVLDGLMASCALLLMLAYSATLAGLVCLVVLGYALTRWAWYGPLRSATEEQISHAARQQSHFLETVRGVRSIKLFNRYDERRATWLNLMVAQVNADVRTQKLGIAFRASNGTLFGLVGIGVVWLAATLVMDKKLSLGMVFAFLAYQKQFTDRVGSLIDKVVEFKMLGLQAARLADIALSEPERDSRGNQPVSDDGDYSLRIKGLRFRYADGEPYVLDGIDLHIAAGESVAIIGASGCGKTTLLKLLLGIYVPNEGDVRVGRTSLKKLGVSAFRSMIGTVMQDDHLFAGSIAENICFFDNEPDQAWVQACAEAAAIHDDIAQMPMGYQTLVGDMGAAISGGQQQRILLARALYKRPKLLFLDEATSHLDVRCEQVVNEAIKALKVTRIIVAHRPETIAMAGRVVVLHAGKVVQDSAMATPLSALKKKLEQEQNMRAAATA